MWGWIEGGRSLTAGGAQSLTPAGGQGGAQVGRRGSQHKEQVGAGGRRELSLLLFGRGILFSLHVTLVPAGESFLTLGL